MPKQIEFEGTVHEFPDDFSDADIAAALGGDAPQAESSSATPGILAGLGAAASAPAIVAGINKVAPMVGAAAKMKIPGIGVRAPGAAAVMAAGQAFRGDYKGAAQTAGVAAATSALPKVAAMAQKATGPLSGVTSTGAKWAMKAGMGPALTRGASWLSRAAGALSLPLTILSADWDLAQHVKSMADDPKESPERRALMWEVLDRMGDPNQLK